MQDEIQFTDSHRNPHEEAETWWQRAGWGVWGDPDRTAGNSLQVSRAIDVTSLFI